MSSSPIQQVRRQGFSQEAFGALKDRVTNKEDHGPKYVYSPGEPFHRVQERDGVPHVYPGLILGFESYINWHTSYTKPEVGTAFTADQANDTVDPKRYGAPRFAGSIAEEIVLSPTGKEKCIVSIGSFENVAFEDTRWEEFNAIIMPEPIFWNEEEVPFHLLPRWRSQSPEIGERCRQIGGLAVREEYLKAALKQFLSTDAPIAQMYASAVQQMLSANEAFRRFAITYLQASDRTIEDRETTGKAIYDTRDLRLQWLTAHKSKAETVPVFNVQMPQQAAAPVSDVERRACPECGEMIAVAAKLCIHCKTRFDAPVFVDTALATEAAELHAAQGSRPSETPAERRERKAREMRERNGVE